MLFPARRPAVRHRKERHPVLGRGYVRAGHDGGTSLIAVPSSTFPVSPVYGKRQAFVCLLLLLLLLC